MNTDSIALWKKSFFLAVYLLVVTGISGYAQSILISASPHVGFPLSPTNLYTIDAGASLDVRFDPFLRLFEGITRIGYSNLVVNNGLESVSIVRAEGGIVYPFIKNDTFSLGPALYAGAYGAFRTGASAMFNPMVELGLRTEFKFGNMRLAIVPNAECLFAKKDNVIGSFLTTAGVTVTFAFNPASSAHRALIQIENPQLDPFFPVIYKFYSINSFGKARIINKERSDISNIVVTFVVPAYMDGPQTIMSIPKLKQDESANLPIMALFKNNVLGITETDTAQARIQVKYSIGKDIYSIDWDGTINIQGRNAIVWNDDRIAAAFVTARDPTILKLSRNTVASLPKEGISIPSASFRNASILFQALESYGLKYVIDPKGSYATMKGKSEAVDYLQFPIETLTYRTGDCDDLSTLYLAMLESVGIETAFITVPGHIYAAFAIDANIQSVKGIFNDLDKLIFAADKIWVPIETTALGKGFAEAWTLGAREWKEAERQHAASLVPVHEAWRTYEPSFISSSEKQDVVAKFPDTAVVAQAYTTAMKSLANRELSAMVSTASNGSPANNQSPKTRNHIGAIYARYGMMDTAEAAFKDAALSGYIPALINLGNIRFREKEFIGAADYYRKALTAQPENADATLGLSRSLFEAGLYADAAKLYITVQKISPEKAASFAYLADGVSKNTSRATDNEVRYSLEWLH